MGKARDLNRGDIFRMHLYCEVLSAIPIAGGKHIKVKLAVEDQGRRRNRGTLTGSDKPSDLEFLDSGHTLEFICKPGRLFSLYKDWDDDDDDGDEFVVDPPPSSDLVDA
jgi:hypothetical protein